MTLIDENTLIELFNAGLSRGFVLRRRKGQLILCKKPAKRVGLSELQQKHVSRFKDAVAYAKIAMADEDIRKGYDKRAKRSKGILSGFNVAVSDYMHAPIIRNIDLRRYGGGIGDEITISATDDFQVAGVMVEIFRDDGSLLEVGMADRLINDLDRWVYYAQSSIACVAGFRVNVRVTDLPGNAAEKAVSV